MRIGIDARKIADFGIGTYIHGLLDALADLPGPETYVAFAPRHAELPIGVEHYEVDAPHYSVRELVILGRAIASARLDVFHAPHYVVPLTRCPTVVTIHDLIHLHTKHRNPVAPLYAKAMLSRAVRKARKILTVTEYVRRDIIETFRCPPDKVLVTPNGVNEVFFTPTRYPLPATRSFVYAGNDKPHKNLDRLVAAAERANVPLILAGGRFERFAGRAQIAGFVSVEELAALYRGAIAVVLPSIEEGFGLPAAEAMACGTAVITSTAPALVEITGDAALHVDPFDVDAIADAMRTLARDASLRAELGERGRERARKLTWQRCAETTREVYRSL